MVGARTSSLLAEKRRPTSLARPERGQRGIDIKRKACVIATANVYLEPKWLR